MKKEISIPKISLELAEETGWHIGDGSMNYYRGRGLYQLRGHIEDDKQHYIDRIKPLFDKLYKTDIKLREMPSTRVYGFQIWNSELVNLKKDLGLQLGKKLNINIPKIFLKSRELKIAVIRGIFDTDGGIYLEKKNNKLYPRMTIRTISENLANQLIEIFKELGLRATKYSELFNKQYNQQRTYVITLRGEEMFNRFINLISPKNQKHIGRYKEFIKSKAL